MFFSHLEVLFCDFHACEVSLLPVFSCTFSPTHLLTFSLVPTLCICFDQFQTHWKHPFLSLCSFNDVWHLKTITSLRESPRNPDGLLSICQRGGGYWSLLVSRRVALMMWSISWITVRLSSPLHASNSRHLLTGIYKIFNHPWMLTAGCLPYLGLFTWEEGGGCVVFYGAKNPLLKKPKDLVIHSFYASSSHKTHTDGSPSDFSRQELILKCNKTSRKQKTEVPRVFNVSENWAVLLKKWLLYSSTEKLPLLFETNHEGFKLEKLKTIAHKCNYWPKVKWSVSGKEAGSACKKQP